MKLRDRARRLFGREALSEHAVVGSRVEHAVFNDVRKRSSTVADLVADPPKLPDGTKLNQRIWDRLGEDVWTELYGDDEPTIRSREKVDPAFRVNRELADKQARSDSFRDTRSMTRGQVSESAIGWLGAMSSLKESYASELAEHADRAHDIATGEDSLEAIDAEMERLRQSGNEIWDDPEAIKERMRELGSQKRRTVEELKRLQSEQAHHAGDLIDAAKGAVAKAAQEAADAVETMSLLPGKGAGPRSRLSTDEIAKFAVRVGDSQVLKQVLEMMGRLDLSMGTVRRQMRKGGYEEMVDIEMGNELRNVLPQEKALLMHPLGRRDFYRRYHEATLMQYEIWSEQELKRGPIIFGADSSGSTAGMPNVFIRGLTLASCMIGNREGRNTAALEFGSAGELREFFFPGDRPLDTAASLDFAEHFFGGGTDINQVMRRAAELIREEAPFHSADLVIVTDGGDIVTEETIALRDELRAAGVKIHGLAVACAPTDYLLQTCDNINAVWDFAGPNNTSDRLAIDLS